MMTSPWFATLVAVLVLDMRTGALQQKELVSLRCFSCAVNETSCKASMTLECPVDRPHCATTAVAPNFTSSLSCAAAAKTPCTLMQTSDKVFKLTCVCMENLCNAPFSAEIQYKLLNFATFNISNNATERTEAFFKYANVTENDVYKTISNKEVKTTIPPITIKTSGSTVVPTTVVPAELIVPRAEALKHDAPAPSDDDEDESEGSGTYDEMRHQRQPAAAPANPSSYLPAEKSKAYHILPSLLAVPPILYFLV